MGKWIEYLVEIDEVLQNVKHDEIQEPKNG